MSGRRRREYEPPGLRGVRSVEMDRPLAVGDDRCVDDATFLDDRASRQEERTRFEQGFGDFVEDPILVQERDVFEFDHERVFGHVLKKMLGSHAAAHEDSVQVPVAMP